ncbi:MAG: Mur ligase family protein, partial [Candidatus Kerfeldbacteria bacterium]
MFERYHNAVAHLEGLIAQQGASYMRAEADWQFFLDRTKKFADRLGNPEQGFKFIHVAGTAGKGSTAMMTYNILREAGYSVGVFVSPHVTTSIERIAANGMLIGPDEFALEIEEIMPIVKEIQKDDPAMVPSYSEIFFAMALQYFKRIGCEWVVLETGCGGLYDKTNIIPAPEVALLTNVSLDHCDLLGNTVEEIAVHKAGIIKEGSALFSTETKPEV